MTTAPLAESGLPVQWPSLVNGSRNVPIISVSSELKKRQETMGFWRKNWWRTRRRLHQWRRGIVAFTISIYEEIAAAKKKTFIELITGIPIGLLVIPQFREKVFKWRWGTVAFLLFIVVRVIFGVWRRGSAKQATRDDVGLALKTMLPIIECTQIHVHLREQNQQLPAAQLQRNIETVLCAIIDLTCQAQQLPRGVSLCANLMIPMPVQVIGEASPQEGCGVVVYSRMPANPAWSKVVLGDFGAGSVFRNGKVAALEDSKDPVWCGLFNKSRSRSFACFPVRDGAADVIAVVNVDANRPMILTRKNAAALFVDVLAPPLNLLGDLLKAASILPTVSLGGVHADDSATA